MATLTYFTAKLNLQAVTADEDTDLDTDPQTKGVYAGVTLTPVAIEDGRARSLQALLQAGTLSPAAALLALAPVDARIDNGRLMLRVDPDRPVLTFANLAAFPGTGNTAKVYKALDTGAYYEWNGSAYVSTLDYAPVRLVAGTAVLALPAGVTLGYRCDFDHVRFNRADQYLPSFTFAAPSTDVVVDLATVTRVD